MSYKTISAIGLLFACNAFGQAATEGMKVFDLSALSQPEANEVATAFKSVLNIQRVFADDSRRLTVRATPQQLTTATWLLSKLFQAPGEDAYAIPDSNDVVLVARLANTEAQKGLNELVTSLRAIADIQRILAATPHHAIALRVPAEQLGIAKWLIQQLDRTADTAPPAQPPQYQLPGSSEVATVFYFPADKEDPEMFQTVTAMRVAADVRHIFYISNAKAIALRGTPAQIADAAKLATPR